MSMYTCGALIAFGIIVGLGMSLPIAGWTLAVTMFGGYVLKAVGVVGDSR